MKVSEPKEHIKKIIENVGLPYQDIIYQDHEENSIEC